MTKSKSTLTAGLLAALILTQTACDPAEVTGTVVGGVAGALLGGRRGDAGGAIVGSAVGAIAGGLIGHVMSDGVRVNAYEVRTAPPRAPICWTPVCR